MSVLIAIEGIDGSGGSTHSKLLAEWLNKKFPENSNKILHSREPSDLPIGNLMRDYLKKPQVHPTVDALLYAADRAEHYYSIIKPAMDSGKIVISDRHKLSSLVYQTVQGLDSKWVRRINSAVPDPDLNIILDVDPKVSLERKLKANNSSMDKFETLTILNKARAKYLELASRYSNIITVSSLDTVEETQEEIRRVVEVFLKKKDILK
ncbi:MAG: putative thymidylate kinase [Candidatus Heimdallarchaeota archaeon LC_3]|nr:MAG: putative thymidylate kinase [Candidatus Heimdallarchaeota archaeon LC_3]